MTNSAIHGDCREAGSRWSLAVWSPLYGALGVAQAIQNAMNGPWTAVMVVSAAVMVNAGIFLLAFRVSTAHSTNMRDLMPGATTAAITWQTLQLFGTADVGSVVKDAGMAYCVFALVLGLLGWIYVGAVQVVSSVEINVVRAKGDGAAGQGIRERGSHVRPRWSSGIGPTRQA